MKKIILYHIYAVVLLALLYHDEVINLVLKAINLAIAPIKCSGILLCAIGITLIVLIECLRQNYPILRQKIKKPSPSTTPLYSDQPTADDKYGRDIPAALLIEKIFSTFNASQASKGSFVININEAYGFGKTSFLRIFEKQLLKSSQSFLYIDYRPWLCENEQAIVKEFFTLLGEKLKDYSLNDDITQYMAQLMEESSQVVPWWAKVPLSFIAKNIKPRPLQEIHDAIRDALQTIDKPIIVTIDDVDRLQEKELTAVLKLIRDTADFPNIFYIVAAENAHLHQMLSRIGVQHPDIYLKKFFNLDFLLPAHDSVEIEFLLSEVKSILIKYNYNRQGVENIMPKFRNMPNLRKAFSNMREVNRFLNTFTVHLDMFKYHNTLGAIDVIELFYLTIIKHLRIDVYKKLRDRNDEYLQITEKNNDRYFMLKDHVDINSIRMSAEANQMIKSITDEDSKKTTPKDETPKEPTITETLEMTEITHEDVVIHLLGRLFGNDPQSVINNRGIRRCNCYHIYFSGKSESDKLTYAESISILKLDLNKYKETLKTIFESYKEDSLQNDFSYAFHQSGISRPDGIKKFNVFIRFRYQYKRFESIKSIQNVTDYINWVEAAEPFSDFLYNIYGRERNAGTQKEKQAEEEMRDFCKAEEDTNMLLLAFSIISRQLGIFCFSRTFVNDMLKLLADRFFTANLKDNDYPAQDDIFYTLKLMKEEIHLRDYWNALFIDYLSENKNRAIKWLSSIITEYPNGNIDWHYDHRMAILGEYSSDWDIFISQITQKIPECKEAFEDLSHLLGYRRLSDMNLSNSKFIQMVREVQQTSTDID